MKRNLLLIALLTNVLLGSSQLVMDKLVSHYPLNGNANDMSNYALNGEIIGAVPTTDRFGNEYGAFYFDGIDDKIICDTNNRGIVDSVTVCAWIKSTEGDFPAVVTKYVWHEDKGYTLRLREVGDAYMEGRDGNSIFSSSGSDSNSLYDGEWHFLVGQVAANTWRIWVDGKMIAEYKTDHSSVKLANTGNLTIGALSVDSGEGNHRHYKGSVDDVRVYADVLDSIEIDILFSEGRCRETVYDTVKVYDTVTVTDTLKIDVLLSVIDQQMPVVKLYPNPTKDFLYIEVDGNQQISDYTIKVLNIQSQVFFESLIDSNKFQINLGNMTAGLYLVQIIDNEYNVIQSRKIVLE